MKWNQVVRDNCQWLVSPVTISGNSAETSRFIKYGIFFL
jgi:hypothetical protein